MCIYDCVLQVYDPNISFCYKNVERQNYGIMVARNLSADLEKNHHVMKNYTKFLEMQALTTGLFNSGIISLKELEKLNEAFKCEVNIDNDAFKADHNEVLDIENVQILDENLVPLDNFSQQNEPENNSSGDPTNIHYDLHTKIFFGWI
ncbi:hypothetical protein FQR65_LT13658 [Abscondita terminalis]|nr:hypothetical protein FQR65_LT13658 [Abscondita terminalis]